MNQPDNEQIKQAILNYQVQTIIEYWDNKKAKGSRKKCMAVFLSLNELQIADLITYLEDFIKQRRQLNPKQKVEHGQKVYCVERIIQTLKQRMALIRRRTHDSYKTSSWNPPKNQNPLQTQYPLKNQDQKSNSQLRNSTNPSSTQEKIQVRASKHQLNPNQKRTINNQFLKSVNNQKSALNNQLLKSQNNQKSNSHNETKEKKNRTSLHPQNNLDYITQRSSDLFLEQQLSSLQLPNKQQHISHHVQNPVPNPNPSSLPHPIPIPTLTLPPTLTLTLNLNPDPQPNTNPHPHHHLNPNPHPHPNLNQNLKNHLQQDHNPTNLYSSPTPHSISHPNSKYTNHYLATNAATHQPQQDLLQRYSHSLPQSDQFLSVTQSQDIQSSKNNNNNQGTKLEQYQNQNNKTQRIQMRLCQNIQNKNQATSISSQQNKKEIDWEDEEEKVSLLTTMDQEDNPRQKEIEKLKRKKYK